MVVLLGRGRGRTRSLCDAESLINDQTQVMALAKVSQGSQVSPLLDLPTEMLAHVYSMLEITDRIRLNIALPKGAAMTTDTDRKLAVVHRFFKKRARIVGASAVTREDTSTAMRTFFYENKSDPTIRRVLCESPQLATIAWRPSFDPFALISGQEHMLQAGAFAWAEDERDALMSSVTSRGTPAIFDLFMASDNPVRTHVVNDPGSFVFGLVNLGNTQGLLSHVMQLADDNSGGFCVTSARNYISSLRISRIFIARPLQLKSIMDDVGIPMPVMEELLEEAARRMLLTTVEFLMKMGVRL